MIAVVISEGGQETEIFASGRVSGLRNCRKSPLITMSVVGLQDIKSYCPDIHGEFPYAIIGDETREIAVLLDMISENDKDNPELATTVRALYIISPDHKLKLSMLYPTSTGRNVE